jgi:ferric-dicitrate binding protein FerR (iron transport regulator)
MDDESARRAVTRQAANWFLLCSQGELTAQQRQALLHWLQAAPEHAAALAELCRLQARMPVVSACALKPVSQIRVNGAAGRNARLH